MDWQAGFNVAFSIGAAISALWAAAENRRKEELRKELDSMKHDHRNLLQTVSNLRETIPAVYATIDDLNRSVDQISERVGDVFTTLNRMEDKLDRIKDKQ